MAKPKVFVFAPADPTGEAHKMLEDAGCELILGDASWDTPQGNSEAQMVRLTEGCEAMMGTSIRSTPITQKIMQASKNLRIVAKFTIGVDDVDVDAATELGILVTHAPIESNWGNIAEVTVTFLLSLLKDVPKQDAEIKSGGWWVEGKQGSYVGTRQSDGYTGITLGIIGLGRIGGRVAALMRPWNINILAYDPY